MIWGVGCVRSGTKSLAKQLGGVHEPKPWLQDLPVRHYEKNLSEEETVKLRDMLSGRLGRGTTVVDASMSYCMDLIEEIDRDARFVWVLRNPFQQIASHYLGGGFSEQDGDGFRKLRPLFGVSRIQRCAAYWQATNTIILQHLEETDRPWRGYWTDRLIEHENDYPRKQMGFSRNEAAWIFDLCEPTWRMCTDAIWASRHERMGE